MLIKQKNGEKTPQRITKTLYPVILKTFGLPSLTGIKGFHTRDQTTF